MANVYPQNTQYNTGGSTSPSFKMPQAPASLRTPTPSAPTVPQPAPSAPSNPLSAFPSLAGFQMPDANSLLAEAQAQVAKALNGRTDAQNRKSAWSGLSSGIPQTWSQISSAFNSGRTSGQLVGAPPISGDRELLSQYQKEHPEDPLVFSAPQKFAGWSSPSDKAEIVKTASGGYYVNDPENPNTIAHESRGGSAAENKQILNGLSSHFFQIDHRTPLQSGGVDTLGQKQIIPIGEHAIKTAVQSVPYTLWFAFKDNPDLAKKYGMDALSLSQLRMAQDDWKNFSYAGIPTPDENGKVPLDVAVKTWKAWHEQPKVGLWDVIKEVPSAAGKVATGIGNILGHIGETVPVVGPAVVGGVKGMFNEWGMGYPEKFVEGAFKPGIDKQGAFGDLKGMEVPWANNESLKAANAYAENASRPVGDILGNLLAFTTGPGLLKGAFGLGEAAKTGEAAATVAKGVKTPGLLTKAIARFGINGTKAAENTERLAAEAVKAGEMLAPASKAAESLPFLKAIEVNIGEVPLVGDMLKAAIKTAQKRATLENVGTMITMNLLHQQDDRSMKATIDRAIGDVFYGTFLGHDAHSLEGYLKVFAKSLGIGMMQQTFLSPDKHDFGADLENALLMTALHGLGHKNAKATEAGMKERQEAYSEYQKQLQDNLTKQEGWRATNILAQVLPETFKPTGKFSESFDPTKHWESVPKASEDIELYRAKGNNAIDELARTDFLKDKNGRVVKNNGAPVSAWSDADVKLAKQKFNAALRVFEKNGAPPDKQVRMEIADLKSYADLWKRQLSSSDPGSNPSVVESINKDREYLFTPSTSDGSIVTQRMAPDPEVPIGKTQGTGLGVDRLPGALEDHAATIKAMGDRTGQSRVTSKAVIELVPGQGIKEQTRRMSKTPDELASMDTKSDPGSVLRVSVYTQDADGNLTRRTYGYIPSEYRLHDAPFALNKVEGVSTGAKDVYNLDKDTLGAWMTKNKVGAMYADVAPGGIGRDPNNPYLKIEVTKDNLERSLQTFAGTHPSDLPQLRSTADVVSSAINSKTPQKAQESLDVIAKKMPIEPAHELLDHAYYKGQPIPFSDDVKAALDLAHRGIASKDPKVLMDSINSNFGRILDEETAQKWLSDPDNVRTADVLNLFTKSTSAGNLSEEGLALKKSISAFFGNEAFAAGPFAGWFNQAPIMGRTGEVSSTEKGEYKASPAEELAKSEPNVETSVSKEGVPDFLDWEKPKVEERKGKAPEETSAKADGDFKAMSPEEVAVEEKKAFKRMPKAQKAVVMSEPAPDAKPVDPPSIVNAPPKENVALAERNIGAPVEVSSIDALKNLETSERRIVDGVDVDDFELPTHESGRLDGEFYRGTNKIFSEAQKGFEPNSEEYKKLEKGKKLFSRDFLRTAAQEATERHGGNTNKAFDEILSRVEKRATELAKEAGVPAHPLFPDKDAKTAFKGLLRKITGEKARNVLDFNEGSVVGNIRVDGKELPSYADKKIAKYMKEHPEVGDISIVHVRGDSSASKTADLSRDLFSNGYVYLGNPSGKSNSGFAIKFSKALAEKGPTGGSDEQRFLSAFISDVLGAKGKEAENYGALYKRWKNLDNHDPFLDLRDDNGDPVTQRHYFYDETLGDVGVIDSSIVKSPEDQANLDGVYKKILGDGGILVPEEGFPEYAKQLNMVGERGSIKTSIVHDADGGTVLMKAVAYPMPKNFQSYLERKLGIKFGKFDTFGPTENLKIGKGLATPVEGARSGVLALDIPASSVQVKMTNPHKEWGAKFSSSIYARLSADAGLNEEILSKYKPAVDRFLELNKELAEGKKTNADIRATLEKFKDLGIQIDQSDFDLLDKKLKQNASGRDIWQKLQKGLAQKFRGSVLSGKMSFEGTHLAIMPDFGWKGGVGLMSLEDSPEARNAWGSFVDLSNMLRGAKGKEGLNRALQSWEATFGRGSATVDDIKALASKKSTLWDALGVLEEAKRNGKLTPSGDRFLRDAYNKTFLLQNESMLPDSDHGRVNGRDILTTRFPVTRLTANARSKALRGSDFGHKLPDGVMVASNHDVSIRKEGDYDDHYSIFPEGGDKGVPKSLLDAIEAEREREGDVVLAGLDSYSTGPLSPETAIHMGEKGNEGKMAIGVSSSIARVLTAMEDSGMAFAGKKLKMTPEKKRLLSQVQQEAADAVNKKNLSERLQRSGFNDVSSYLVDKLFELDGDPSDKRNKEIRDSISQFQTIFELANETKALDNVRTLKGEVKFGDLETQKVAMAIQKANKIRDSIISSGGKVPPVIDLVSLMKDMVSPPKVSIEGDQMSDKFAGEELLKFAKDKYGDEALRVKPGSPEQKILNKAAEINKVVRSRNAKFKEGNISSKGEKERRAFNDETKQKIKEKINETVELYNEIRSTEGLSKDQIRRITFGLLTRPELNRNFTGRVSDKRPYGNKDVQRLSQLFDDDELARAYYGFRDAFSPLPRQAEAPSKPQASTIPAPAAAIPSYNNVLSAIKAKQSPTAQFKTLGKKDDKK